MKMSKTMIRLITFSGMIAALALVAVVLATLPQSGRVQAAQESGNCHIVQVVAADDGYGISGSVQRRVCD
jgi:hypothetical protein